MKKTYAVTGATGYIGYKFIKKLILKEDVFVYAIVRKGSEIKIKSNNIKYVEYDGTEDSIESALENSEYLVHLGALYKTGNDEVTTRELIESNITFSTLLFNVANRVNKEIVIATASTFSFLDGEGEYKPATLYAATKRAVENIALFYEDLSIHFLTFPDTYGDEDWRPKIHNLLARNTEWPFKFKSNGQQEMRFLNIEDIIGHIEASLEDRTKGVHIHDIYSTGVLITLEDLSKKITSNLCLFSEVAPTPIPKEAREISKDTGYRNKHIDLDFSILEGKVGNE